jgi:hypothetical protein
LAVTSAFTRAIFFRCFFLVLRSFSRPVAIVSPNCKKWKRNEPFALALCESVQHKALHPSSYLCAHVALRGRHPHAKMPRIPHRVLKKPGLSGFSGLFGLFGLSRVFG